MGKKVLAVVENIEITEDDLENIINSYPEEKKVYFKEEKLRNRLLNEIIGNELFYCYGKEQGIQDDKEFQAEVERYTKELTIKIMMKKILAGTKVTEEAANKYYNENQDEFTDPEKVATRHILVETEEEALKIKKDIEDKVISFEDAAMKNTMCPTCMDGGFIGSVSRGMLYPEIDAVIFNWEVNKLTNPIKTEMGYHIVLVEDKKEARMKGFDEVKKELIKKLTQEKQREKFDKYVEILEGRFNVKRNL